MLRRRSLGAGELAGDWGGEELPPRGRDAMARVHAALVRHRRAGACSAPRRARAGARSPAHPAPAPASPLF